MTGPEPPADRARSSSTQPGADALSALLAEQVSYYSAIAPAYEQNAIAGWSGGALERALDAFAPRGEVLEIACGTGVWTEQLARHASTLTAVDASPEMLALARARVGERPVAFVQADIFAWRAERRYDVVFFGFWLSHVPLACFAGFWALVESALEPGGRVFFLDDAHRTSEELVEGESSEIVQRRLPGSGRHRLVKVPHTPEQLERRLSELGWEIAVTQAEGPFFWGQGGRAPGSR